MGTRYDPLPNTVPISAQIRLRPRLDGWQAMDDSNCPWDDYLVGSSCESVVSTFSWG